MKFSIGDRVLMKRTGEEGFITAFISKELMEVEMGDIRFPVYADEIEHPYLKWFTDPKRPVPVKRLKEIPAEKEDSKRPRLSRGIYLSFLPQFAQGTSEDIIEAFRIHLLNETVEHLQFSYHARTSGGATILQLNGTLHPFANIFLHTISLEALNAQPRFNWSVAPKDKPESGMKDVLRIRPAQLVRHIHTLLRDGAPSFMLLLTQDAVSVALATPASFNPRIQTSGGDVRQVQLHTESVAVLDLHIGEADDAPPFLLAAQIRMLEQHLDAAYMAGRDKMLVIHGIGNGTLRDAVHEVLRQTPFIRSFSHYWMASYGWGATEVFFS